MLDDDAGKWLKARDICYGLGTMSHNVKYKTTKLQIHEQHTNHYHSHCTETYSSVTNLSKIADDVCTGCYSQLQYKKSEKFQRY